MVFYCVLYHCLLIHLVITELNNCKFNLWQPLAPMSISHSMFGRYASGQFPKATCRLYTNLKTKSEKSFLTLKIINPINYILKSIC